MPSDDRPVVVVVVKGLGIGGAEKLISEGARHWDRSAFDYRVAYVLPWKDQLVADLEALDVPVTCVGSPRGLTPRAALALRRALKVWNTALVHAHLPTAGVLARLVTPRPVVYTEHNLVWSYRAPTRLFNRLTYGRNAAVTAVSDAVAATVASYPGPAVEVVPNGVSVAVEPAARDGARLELGLGADDSLVVHVGNIRPGKGHDMLIEFAGALLAHRPKATVVSVGGEKYPGGLDQLRSAAEEAGLNGRLRFLGRRSDALSFIAAADVYVNPADFEGLPVTILEAMALGRPVVATAVGGVPALISDGVNGRLVPPRSPRALVDAVADLLDDPGTAGRIGAAGADTVAAEYGLESMVRAFEDIYRSVLT